MSGLAGRRCHRKQPSCVCVAHVPHAGIGVLTLADGTTCSGQFRSEGPGASGSVTTVLLAFGVNLLIAAVKSAAAALTGSVSLLAEAAHSWADAGNEIILLIASRRSRRPRTASSASRRPWPPSPSGRGQPQVRASSPVSSDVQPAGGCRQRSAHSPRQARMNLRMVHAEMTRRLCAPDTSSKARNLAANGDPLARRRLWLAGHTAGLAAPDCSARAAWRISWCESPVARSSSWDACSSISRELSAPGSACRISSSLRCVAACSRA